MSFFSKFKRKPDVIPSGPDGQRAYIIGDIHGCMDALKKLLADIEKHNQVRDKTKTTLIFLGDLIDRGPQSREVVEFLSQYAPDFAEVIFLSGNHEEVFLAILAGDSDSIRAWFGFGGRACARSYGVKDLGQINIDPTPVLHDLIRKVPKHHIEFLSRFKDYHVFGDYVCVHAGIKPKIKLEEQSSHDLRWIRTAFLNYTKKHSHIVVHGHTIIEAPTHYGNRIAIDTGAYKEDGSLTALCIDGTEIRFLTAISEAIN